MLLLLQKDASLARLARLLELQSDSGVWPGGGAGSKLIFPNTATNRIYRPLLIFFLNKPFGAFSPLNCPKEKAINTTVTGEVERVAVNL